MASTKDARDRCDKLARKVFKEPALTRVRAQPFHPRPSGMYLAWVYSASYALHALGPAPEVALQELETLLRHHKRRSA